MSGRQDLRLAEALVFASAEPVTEARVAALLGLGEPEAHDVLVELAAACAGRGVELVRAGAGWMFRTAPDLADRLAVVVERPRRLPRSVMETLAVIAMHQPCTRAEIEARRGVALAQNVLETLLENELVRPAGRREVPGRPTLWATTDAFLVRFGLSGLDELPRRSELLADLPVPAGDLASPPEDADALSAPGGSCETGGGTASPRPE